MSPIGVPSRRNPARTEGRSSNSSREGGEAERGEAAGAVEVVGVGGCMGIICLQEYGDVYSQLGSRVCEDWGSLCENFMYLC